MDQDQNVGDPAFEFEGAGTIVADGAPYDTSLKVQISPSGHVEVVVEAPLAPDTTDLFRFLHSKGQVAPFYGLRCTAAEGVELFSDHLVCARSTTPQSPEGTTISATFHAYRFDVTWPVRFNDDDDPDEVVLEYLIPGARGFGQHRFETEVGLLTYGASPSVTDATEISGQVAVRTANTSVEEEIDALVTRILEVLSLAQGTELRWVARKTFADGALHTLRVEPSSWAPSPGFPVFSHLNLDPVLKLAVDSYTPEVREQLYGVITWLLMRPRYREAEFLMGMTALEYLVSASPAAKACPAAVRPAMFDDFVKPSLLESVGRIDGLTEDEHEFLKSQISSLNHTFFRDRLSAMLDADRVFFDDLRSYLPRMSRMRNSIVHTGMKKIDAPDEALIELLAILRELLVRIILTRLDYRGHYYRYLHGPEWMAFPRLEAQDD